MRVLPLRRLARSSGLLSYTLAVGCVAAPPLGDGAETGTSSSGEVPATTSTSTVPGSSGESTLGPAVSTTTASGPDSTTGTGTGAGTGTTGDTTGGPEPWEGPFGCDPQPEGHSAQLEVSVVDEPDTDVVVDTLCELTTLDPLVDGWRLVLQCDATAIEVELTDLSAAVGLPLAAGQVVYVRALHEIPIDSGHRRYLALSEPGGELLLGYWSWGYSPEEGTAEEWYAPLALALEHDVCNPEVYEPGDDGSMFIIDPCGGSQEERLAVLVSLGGARPEQLFDDSRRLVGSYDVWVLRARQTQTFSDDPHCPSSLFEGARVLMIASP